MRSGPPRLAGGCERDLRALLRGHGACAAVVRQAARGGDARRGHACAAERARLLAVDCWIVVVLPETVTKAVC
jgi:hypothetical protein